MRLLFPNINLNLQILFRSTNHSLELTEPPSFAKIFFTNKGQGMKTRVPFQDGLIDEVSGKWVLMECRCKPCGIIIHAVGSVGLVDTGCGRWGCRLRV
jgi:hypothetical protein